MQDGNDPTLRKPEYGRVLDFGHSAVTTRPNREPLNVRGRRPRGFAGDASSHMDRATSPIDRLQDAGGLQLLSDVALRHLELDTLLPALLDCVSDVLDTEAGTLTVLSEDAREVLRRVTTGPADGLASAIGWLPGSDSAAPAYPLMIDAIDSPDAKLEEGGLASLAVLPLFVDGRCVGTLRVGTSRPGRRLRRRASFLALIGDRVALAVERARRYWLASEALVARDRLMTAVCHDLKNPLTSIRLRAEMLRRELEATDTPLAHRYADGMRRMEGSSRRAAHLCDDLIDEGRRRVGQAAPLSRAAVDLVALADDAVRDHQQITRRHTFRFDPAVAELVGLWDATRLERVLSNLLYNAIKYSPTGGEIAVAVSRSEDQRWAVLEVRDQGLGIAAEDLGRVFVRFQRGRNAHSGIPGSGIGLASVRHLLEQHGGSISVESQPGSGSTFTARLPLAPPDDGAMTVASPGSELILAG